jgi:hypothetical protein
MSRLTIFAVLIPFVLISCATTTLTGAWKEPSFNTPIKNVLIVGIGNEESTRRIFEEIISKDIIKAGVPAVQSIKYFTSHKKINKKSLQPLIKKYKFDTVIVVTLAASSRDKRYKGTSDPDRFKSMYGQYGMFNSYSGNRKHYNPSETVSIEINMYETKQAKLVWAIATDTFLPEDYNKEIQTISDLMIKNLKEQKLL